MRISTIVLLFVVTLASIKILHNRPIILRHVDMTKEKEYCVISMFVEILNYEIVKTK
jgi:hypothetical protein